MRRQTLTILLFLAPAAVFVAIFVYYPMLAGGQMAFRRWNLYDIATTPWVGLDNFTTLVQSADFGTILWNTFFWVMGSLVPQFVLGFTLALCLRRAFRLRGVYQAFVFYPWAVCGFLIGILFRWMFNGEFGVVNDLLMKSGLTSAPIPWLADRTYALIAMIVANVWYGVPFFAIMILAALQSVPVELEEAASLDGAGSTRTLFNVIIPYIRPTLLITVLLRVIWIFNFPDIIFAMTRGGPADQTHIMTTYLITETQAGSFGVASALGVMCVSILIAFAVFYLVATRRLAR